MSTESSPIADAPLPCPHCGYDLRATEVVDTSRRCPECGRLADNTRLTEGSLPWLHRRELGWVSAYFATVYRIVRHPWTWPEELGPNPDLRAARSFARVSQVIFMLVLALIAIAAWLWPSFMSELASQIFRELAQFLKAAVYDLQVASDQPFNFYRRTGFDFSFQGSLDLLVPAEVFSKSPWVPILSLLAATWAAARSAGVLIKVIGTPDPNKAIVGTTYVWGSSLLPSTLLLIATLQLLQFALSSLVQGHIWQGFAVATLLCCLTLDAVFLTQWATLVRLFGSGSGGSMTMAVLRSAIHFLSVPLLFLVWFFLIGYAASFCMMVWILW